LKAASQVQRKWQTYSSISKVTQ